MAPCNVARDFFRDERLAREVALGELVGGFTAATAARLAHAHFFEFRRGVLCGPGADALAVFNNNPCPFREAEWAELKRALGARGYRTESEGHDPPPGDESAGYTRALVVRHPTRPADPEEVAELMAAALRRIGRGGQLVHEIYIAD